MGVPEVSPRHVGFRSGTHPGPGPARLERLGLGVEKFLVVDLEQPLHLRKHQPRLPLSLQNTEGPQVLRELPPVRLVRDWQL